MLIKKIIFPLLSVLFTLFFTVTARCADISAASAVVINADTKEIIYEKNAFDKRSMASTTKIMTSLLAVESGRLSEEVTVTAQALAEGTSIGLKEGYVLTLKDIIYGMMLESGNDAANACALFLGGNFDAFASMMNEKAKEIGMTDTSFVTPSGLDSEEHYSTAYDMALLGAYSIENPFLREIFSEKKHRITFSEPEISLTLTNHNKLLDYCEGVFGIKTGFTKKSGRCLVSACERDGATLVCVTLNAPDDWNDHIKLYDLSFAELNKTTKKLTALSEVTVYGGVTDKVSVYCEEYVYHFKEKENIREEIIISPIIYAPIKANDILGKINYYSDDRLIHTSYIRSVNEILSAEETFNSENKFIDLIKKFFFRKGR